MGIHGQGCGFGCRQKQAAAQEAEYTRRLIDGIDVQNAVIGGCISHVSVVPVGCNDYGPGTVTGRSTADRSGEQAGALVDGIGLDRTPV